MSHRISQITTIVLAVAAALMIVAVSWAAWGYYQSKSLLPSPGRPRPLLPDTLAGPTSMPEAADPSDLLAAGSDFRIVDADPAGIAPPPGARRQRTVQMSGGREIGVYLFNGSRDVLESFYAATMASQGWRSLGRTGSGNTMFLRDDLACWIEYQARPGQIDAVVRVVVQKSR